MPQPSMKLAATVLDSPDPRALGRFYARMLGWQLVTDEPGWVQVQASSGPGARPGLSFQHEQHYVRPTWPGEAGKPLMMMHLDIAVTDLDAAVTWATECGATRAEFQPQRDVRVMLDPDGHPFCLFVVPEDDMLNLGRPTSGV